MATTALHPITATEAKALTYITDPKKTMNGTLVTSFGCSNDPEEAAMHFEMIRQAIGTGRQSTLAWHAYQSFKPGEVTAEEALEIGTELAHRLTKDQYQFLVSVHNDTDHVHCHIILSNTNMVNGKSFGTLENRRGLVWKKLRDLSDEICKERHLSVIEDPEMLKGQSWYEWSMDKKKLSWKTKLRFAIDECVAQSSDFQDFLKRCAEHQIEVVYQPDKVINLKFRMQGQERFTRSRTLGWYYEVPQIESRIRYYQDYKIRRTGIIRTAERQGSTRFADIHNMQIASEVLNKLAERGIETKEELSAASIAEHAHRASLVGQLNALQQQINEKSDMIREVKQYLKLRQVYEDYKAVSGVNAKKKFAKEHASDLQQYERTKAALVDYFGGTKIDSVEKLTRQRAELIEQRNALNEEFKGSKKRLKELDYCRAALEDYLNNEHDTQEHKRKKDALE